MLNINKTFALICYFISALDKRYPTVNTELLGWKMLLLTAWPLRDHPSLAHVLWGWWRRVSERKQWQCRWMDCFHLGMDPGQNLRSTRPWISRSFCVMPWVCLFLPFDTLSKPTRLLNSHWGALTEAGVFFPEKKKTTKILQKRNTATETSSSPGTSKLQVLWWVRIYLGVHLAWAEMIKISHSGGNFLHAASSLHSF